MEALRLPKYIHGGSCEGLHFTVWGIETGAPPAYILYSYKSTVSIKYVRTGEEQGCL